MAEQLWEVMKQNLRKSAADPRCPDQFEVPIWPAGGGNVFAMVYGTSILDCEEKARLIAAAPELLAIVIRAASADDCGHDGRWLEAIAQDARAVLQFKGL